MRLSARCGLWPLWWSMSSRRTCCRCRRLAIRIQSRHSSLTVPTNRSATALAFGARTGERITWTPSALNTVSKARVDLPSLSRTRNSRGLSRSGSENTKFLACCAVHAPGKPSAPSRRAEPRVDHDPTDARRRDLHPPGREARRRSAASPTEGSPARATTPARGLRR